MTTNSVNPRPVGVRRALVIGINYLYTGVQLNGCIKDAKHIAMWLELHKNFKSSDILVMTDDQPLASSLRPNKQNILAAINWLVNDARPEDMLFLSFSGHGSYVYDCSEHAIDNHTNIIHVLKRQITEIFDHEIRSRLTDCPAQVRCLFDCCQSGGMFDLKYKLNSDFSVRDDVEESTGNLIVVSACGDNENEPETKEGGLLTTTFLKIIMEYPKISLMELNQRLSRRIVQVHPEIHCGQMHKLNSIFL